MLILNSTDVRTALPMAETIEAMKAAYAALSSGQAEVPLRSRLPVPPQEGVSIFMPAFVNSADAQALAVKVVSVFPHNPQKGNPLIYAAVLVLEAETGKPLALMEGGALTAIRTGAGAGAATDLLARHDSATAAIFGAGVQARTQLEAICTVRNIETAWIYDPQTESVTRFIDEMAGRGPIPKDLRAAKNPAEAVSMADIISAATTSNTPVFDAADLKPGVHINGVGSYTPEMQEIPAEVLRHALVVVDSRSASLVESGDMIQPIQQGLFSEDQVYAEIGEIVLGKKAGRTNSHQTTYFKTVGVAVQDAMAGQLAMRNAEKMGLGQEMDW
jgi:alanine dehydrogenase